MENLSSLGRRDERHDIVVALEQLDALTITSLGAWGGVCIEKRKPMNISICCDHRFVDGCDTASFTQAFKQRLEEPILLLAS